MRTLEEKKLRKIPSSLLGIIIICFFLPFINISCSEQQIVRLTGTQLVTGTTIEKPSAFGGVEKEKIKSEPLILVAFVSVLSSFISSLISKHIATSFFSGLVIPLFFTFKILSDNEAIKKGLTIDYLFPFWLVLLLCLATCLMSLYIHYGKNILAKDIK